MDYSIVSNDSLGDSLNEGYVTATEDTQYLSVLEDTLEDINLTLNNSKILQVNDESITLEGEQIAVADDTLSENQPFIFTIDGSDEVFGIQIAKDDEGNLQKFQFQYRKNSEGDLVPMLETLQIHPIDEDFQQIPEMTTEEMNIMMNPKQEAIKEILVDEDVEEEHNGEVITDKHLEGEEEVEYETLDHNNEHHDVVESKYNIINRLPISQVDIKSEIHLEDVSQDGFSHDDQEYQPDDDEEEVGEEEDKEGEREAQEETDDIQSEENVHKEAALYENVEITEYGNNGGELHEDDELNEDDEMGETVMDGVNKGTEHFEELFIEEGERVIENMASKHMQDEMYQIIELPSEETHLDHAGQRSPSSILKETLTHQKTMNILKKTPTNLFKRRSLDGESKVYFVMKNPEKENVNSMQIEYSPNRLHPRSILKSHQFVVPAEEKPQEEVPVESFEDDKLPRRFARNKEALRVKQFMNFINSTTIQEAPVRKERLPRKQQIKPVERMNEDIVVEEVMVSSEGFVDRVVDDDYVKDFQITDFVEITDSDEDGTRPKIKGKKKKYTKSKSKTPIFTISDTEDSNQSFAEATTSRRLSVNRQTSTEPKETSAQPAEKRRRGRPPKNKKLTGVVNASDSESPAKKSKTETETESDVSGGKIDVFDMADENELVSDELRVGEKTEIKCPRCDKTFPSENSLKTHIQHHNLEDSIKNINLNTINVESKKFVNKHVCSKCGLTFKNSFLLSRHSCPKDVKKGLHQQQHLPMVCAVCNKKFPNLVTLNVHKKVHVKEQLVKSTTTVTVSPSKIKRRTSMRNEGSKCLTCGKICSSKDILATHMKTHKQFTCPTCQSSYESKLKLDLHVRQSCVKFKSPLKKIPSFKVKRSFMPPSRRLSGRLSVAGNINRQRPVATSSGAIPKVSKMRCVAVDSTDGASSSTQPDTPEVKKTLLMKTSYLDVPSASDAGGSSSQADSTPDEGMKKPNSLKKLSCEQCLMKFTSHSKLFNHKVLKHNLPTPDKRILEGKVTRSNKWRKTSHAGVPGNKQLSNAFSNLQSKLDMF